MMRIMDGLRMGRCLDGESLDPQPGGAVHVFPCSTRFSQFLSFGNGREVTAGAIHTTIPLHTRRRIAETGREQEAYMCLGVAGRGNLDEEDWLGRRTEEEEEDDEEEQYEDHAYADHTDDEHADEDQDTFSVDGDESVIEEIVEEIEEGQWPSLHHWLGKQLIATRCSNVGAIINWLVVPFIEEEEITGREDKPAESLSAEPTIEEL